MSSLGPGPGGADSGQRPSMGGGRVVHLKKATLSMRFHVAGQPDVAQPTMSLVPDGELPLYVGDEDIAGVVSISPSRTGALSHQGISVIFEGRVVTVEEKTEKFLQHRMEVKTGPISGVLEIPFLFDSIDKPYEAYRGVHASVHYSIRIVIGQFLSSDIESDFELWIIRYQLPPARALRVRMEVGIPESLTFLVRYSRAKFFVSDLDEPGDAITGTLLFKEVRVRIVSVALSLIKRETIYLGANTHRQSSAVFHQEVLDGEPRRGDSVPIRLFLRDYDLTPTAKEVHNRFSVRYALCLVCKDDMDRRYYHQKEIVIWRKTPASRAPVVSPSADAGNAAAASVPVSAPAPASLPASAGAGQVVATEARGQPEQKPASVAALTPSAPQIMDHPLA